MKLRATWYPRTLAERAAWHFNFSTHAAESGVADGLIAAIVAQIAADAEVVGYFNDYDEYLENEMKKWRAARDAYLDGDEGAVAPKMPTFTVPALPASALTAIAERTEKYADKLRAADDYSPSIGEAYGIVSVKPEPPPVTTKKPAAKVSTGGDFKAMFKISLQGMSGVQMQMTRDGDPVTHKTNFPSGDITDETAPLMPGKAETRQYKFYFLQKNETVGEVSNIYEVTVHA